MLGKLLKHDLKSTARVLLPVQLILAAATILGMILLSVKSLQRPDTMLLLGCLLITYTLMILTLSVITQIYLIVYFYRNMFTHQGYLTFTLPTTPWKLLHSKAIIGFVWEMINTLLTYLSVLLLVGSAAGFTNLGTYLSSLLNGNITNVTINGVTTPIFISLLDILGMTMPQIILFMVMFTLVAAFYSVATGYGSVAIGQLFAKHKVAGTVLTYCIIYFVMQFLYGIVAILASFHSVMQIVQTDISSSAESAKLVVQTMGRIYQPLFLAILLFQLVVGVVLYVASGIIMNKKVNLD